MKDLFLEWSVLSLGQTITHVTYWGIDVIMKSVVSQTTYHSEGSSVLFRCSPKYNDKTASGNVYEERHVQWG
jgi:hypothetical protein